jgi:hypothetical protein
VLSLAAVAHVASAAAADGDGQSKAAKVGGSKVDNAKVDNAKVDHTKADSAKVDYAKVERRIGKEPVYAATPQYALLLFGPQGTLRVWLVVDGKTMYLDRDGDGDLTGGDERLPRKEDRKDVVLRDADGKTRYVITSASTFAEEPQTLFVEVRIEGPVAYHQYTTVELRDKPSAARIAHFHGPLTAQAVTVQWKLPPKLALAAGDEPTDLRALVGTLDAEHGCWVVVRSHVGNDKLAFPGAEPVVDVEFPAKTPGGAPLKRRFALAEFC